MKIDLRIHVFNNERTHTYINKQEGFTRQADGGILYSIRHIVAQIIRMQVYRYILYVYFYDLS